MEALFPVYRMNDAQWCWAKVGDPVTLLRKVKEKQKKLGKREVLRQEMPVEVQLDMEGAVLIVSQRTFWFDIGDIKTGFESYAMSTEDFETMVIRGRFKDRFHACHHPEWYIAQIEGGKDLLAAA